MRACQGHVPIKQRSRLSDPRGNRAYLEETASERKFSGCKSNRLKTGRWKWVATLRKFEQDIVFKVESKSEYSGAH